jgi:hypothetical protein
MGIPGYTERLQGALAIALQKRSDRAQLPSRDLLVYWEFALARSRHGHCRERVAVTGNAA